MNVLSLDERVRVTAALVEGNSLRSTSRLTGIDRGTIGAWGISLGTACDNLHHERVRGLYSHLVQLDEIWTFVHTKERRRKNDDPEEFGDQYTFVGIDANAKVIIAYKVGKRTAANTVAFAHDLRARIVGVPQVSTDGFSAYRDALEQAFGSRVHHGVAVKLYEDEDEGRAEHRYAPGRVTSIQRTRVSGSPIEEYISTSYIERQNLTMRQGIRRFTRLTSPPSRRRIGGDSRARRWLFAWHGSRASPSATVLSGGWPKPGACPMHWRSDATVSYGNEARRQTGRDRNAVDRDQSASRTGSRSYRRRPRCWLTQ